MLIEATTPRILIKVEGDPYIRIHTLRKVGTSKGEVIFGAYATGGRLPPGAGVPPPDTERGDALALRSSINTNARILEPDHIYDIEGEDGFQALEYTIPFWELFREEDKKRNMYLVPFCSGGFSITARSAFRSDPRTYDERVFTAIVVMPVTGGGAIRIGNSEIDLSNPTFDPWAPDPRRSYKNLELQDIYNRTHQLGNQSAINERREARIRAAEASMEAERRARSTLPTLPERLLPKERLLPPKG